MFQVTGVVLGALVLWVIFVLVRMPKRERMGVAGKKPDEPKAKAEKAEKAEHEHDDEGAAD